MLLMPVVPAQESRTEINSEDIGDWVGGADSIVVGTFRSGWAYPWLDGWHHYSEIEVREHLVPNRQTGSVRLGWLRPYGASCLICNDWRPFDNQSGIWFLRHQDGLLKIFGGTKGWCSAPLELRYLDAVKNALRSGHHHRP
jgi:hypothetical protein